ncbi:hypothetical protein FFLO_04000 [Filobasidium floriforme]|uniref:Uncharacterized protein n=1 Tax=Filobasidium floriforme TaxID=5210 RepID=A0A8K0JJP7_9TREE|nr:hypothetical protein FFLO_04000 [Filobasidium floriforme]
MSSSNDRPDSPTRYSREEEREEEADHLIPEPPLNPNRPMHADTRAAFNQPPPSRLSRAALIAGILLLLWVASKLGQWGQPVKPQIIYANRYSDEHKYRPAASPVITETLKDGRIRLRGANVAGVGIQATDLPKTPQQIAREKKEIEKKALEDAKVKLGLKKKRTKEQEKKAHQKRMAKRGEAEGMPTRPGPGGGMGGKMGGKRAPGGRGGKIGL